MIISALVYGICSLIPLIIGIILYDENNESVNVYKPIEVYNAQIYYEADTEKADNAKDNINYNENPLEEYIVGVVGAEMPASFNIEALKAQAVAARTYAVKHLNGNYDNINPSKIGQAYITKEEMKKRWANAYESNYNKVKSAVYATKGQILEYNGEVINAFFHSTSDGKTESAENIWGKSLPYIKSVESKVDEKAPNFSTEVSFEKNSFEEKIKNAVKEAKKLNNIYDSFKITNRSCAGYVLEVSFGGIKVKGSVIRTALGLRSTAFEIKKENGKIIFVTKGYGHGAGMSQYGAEFMAQEGKGYEEILMHYYTDTTIGKIG